MLVHAARFCENRPLRQIVPQAYFIIVCIVPRCHLQGTGTEFGVNISIADDGNLAFL